VERSHGARRALLAGLTLVLVGSACFCALPDNRNLRVQMGSLVLLDSEAEFAAKPSSPRRGSTSSATLAAGTALSTSAQPVSAQSTTTKPTTAEPVVEPTTVEPTTAEPATAEATTAQPATTDPTTSESTTAEPTTTQPTTAQPTTAQPTTAEPTTVQPTPAQPTTAQLTTAQPTTVEPTTAESTTAKPTTAEPKPKERQSRSSGRSSSSINGLDSAVKRRQQRLRNVLASAAAEAAALCIQDDVAYVPLDMPKHDVSYESSLDACQVRCAAVQGCETFTFFPADKSCHVQNGNTARLSSVGAQSGRPTCDAMAFKKL